MKCHETSDARVIFWCPGCEDYHGVRVSGREPVWGWNGLLDRPTFTPSILVNPGGVNPGAPICHSFVTDGVIRFLPDCTHHLAGQSVPLPDDPQETD